jgi:hypothetical protein
MRGQGVGTSIVNEWMEGLDASVKRVKLMASTLGGCDSVSFWSKFGFVKAYTGALYHEIENTMVLGVNGYSEPEIEDIGIGDDGRHWIEDVEDLAHYELFPQTKSDFSPSSL